MNENNDKTAEELAYCVKSDMDIENIVNKFKSDLQELDYGNRVAAIKKAVEHLNQGCTVNYVADGLREAAFMAVLPCAVLDLISPGRIFIRNRQGKIDSCCCL